jgi:uncharacterized OB-fold protein
MTELTAYVCKACGTVSYPGRTCCKSCGKTDFDEIPVEGGAKLLTFTRVYNLSLAYEERYLTIGIVEFENGARALGRLAVDEPEIGMKLTAYVGPVRTQGYETINGLWFRQ